MSNVLVLLQNAWKFGAEPDQRQWIVGAHPNVSRDFWEKALWASPTGTRLNWMLPWECEVRVGNASPVIGNTASSKFPMEPDHVRAQIKAWKPTVVLLLGAEAKKARRIAEDMEVSVVEGPHPAYRVFSREWGANIQNEVCRALWTNKFEAAGFVVRQLRLMP